MKITRFLAAIAGAAAFAVAPAEAALITYNFTPTSAPTPGGGVFTAQAAFDDSLFGSGWHTTSPTQFSASLTDNWIYADRTWEVGEITWSMFKISSSGMLTYASLMGTDSAALQAGFGSTLMAGVGAFVSPVYVRGTWDQLAAAPPDGSVPEGGPGALAAVVVVGMGVVARRQRRKRLVA